MESQRFDESFKHAFEGAELTPSDSVWTNVELGLEKASGGNMKRRLIMFQLLAAASTIFALGFGAVYYLNMPSAHPTENIQASDQSNAKTVTPANSDNKENTHQPQNVVEENTIAKRADKKTDQPKENTVLNVVDRLAQSSDKTSTNVINEDSGVSAMPQVSEQGIAFRYAIKKPVLSLPEKDNQPEPDAGLMLLARLAAEEKKYTEEAEQSTTKEKLWTSVGVAGGMYDPNMSGGSYAVNSNGRTSVAKPSTGTSYSVGVAVGHKLSKRFVVQGGIAYLTQSADYSSNTSRHGVAALAESIKYSGLTDETFVATTPYSINNNLQFISVPLQAGYVLVDRDFAVQLNGGVTTDLFLRNTLTPEDAGYEKVSQSAGEDSPYRSVNFSGSVGTEFSYRITQQYRISLTPGLRYSLNSIYKSEVGTQINPIVYDVSVRVRYIFK